MRKSFSILCSVAAWGALLIPSASAQAAAKNLNGTPGYRLEALTPPPDPEVMAVDFRPDGMVFVCTRRGILYINGEPFGRILPCDSDGRELPAYEGCGALPEGQVFLASHHPGSFDSRSFGPVDIHALQGTVTPLWTF